MGMSLCGRGEILLEMYIACGEDMLYSDGMFLITIAKQREA